VISEILSLTDHLPFKIYETLSKVRKERNDWIHGLKSISSHVASDAIRLAEDMLTYVKKIKLHIPTHTMFVA
jgi:hypothetical protein